MCLTGFVFLHYNNKDEQISGASGALCNVMYIHHVLISIFLPLYCHEVVIQWVEKLTAVKITAF